MKHFETFIKGFDEKARTVTAAVNSSMPDRDMEIILPSSLEKRVKTYMENPVFLWGHAGSKRELTGPENLLGKCLDLQFTEKETVSTFQYAYDQNSKARLCFDLVVGGFLKAFSIGAIPHDYVWIDDAEELVKQLPAETQAFFARGEAYLCYTDMELIEISQVFIGCNREALVRAFKSGAITRKELDHMVTGRDLPKMFAMAKEINLLDRPEASGSQPEGAIPDGMSDHSDALVEPAMVGNDIVRLEAAVETIAERVYERVLAKFETEAAEKQAQSLIDGIGDFLKR